MDAEAKKAVDAAAKKAVKAATEAANKKAIRQKKAAETAKAKRKKADEDAKALLEAQEAAKANALGWTTSSEDKVSILLMCYRCVIVAFVYNNTTLCQCCVYRKAMYWLLRGGRATRRMEMLPTTGGLS